MGDVVHGNNIDNPRSFWLLNVTAVRHPTFAAKRGRFQTY